MQKEETMKVINTIKRKTYITKRKNKAPQKVTVRKKPVVTKNNVIKKSKSKKPISNGNKTKLMRMKSSDIRIENPFIRTQTLELRRGILVMIDLSIEIQQLAFKALQNSDKKLALEVLKLDDRIDWKYNRLLQKATFTLTQSPLARELRRVIGYTQIAKNLEWIGDCAVKIAKFIIGFKNKISASTQKRIAKIHKLLYKSLKKLEIIIIEENPSKALALAKLDDEIDSTIFSVSSGLIKSITSLRTLKLVDERVYVLKVINSLENAADHIVDICENIVYIKTGIIHGLE